MPASRDGGAACLPNSWSCPTDEQDPQKMSSGQGNDALSPVTHKHEQPTDFRICRT